MSEHSPAAHLTAATRWELFVLTWRIVLVVALMLGGYWLIPLSWFDTSRAPLVLLIVGLSAYLMLVIRRMVRLSHADYPMLQLGESVVIVVVGLVCLFAFIYAVLSRNDPAAFSQVVDKHAGLYFSMTVTTTTGFGDIVGVSTAARSLITAQMFITLIVLATAIRGVTSAAQLGSRRARQNKATPSDGEVSDESA